MKDTILGVICGLFACLVIYCMYLAFKTISYELFYEGMVIDTVNEILKSKNLIQ